MEHTFRAAKPGTVRQSDKHTSICGIPQKKEAATAKVFHPRSLVFFKTEGNHRGLDMGDQHFQFRGYGRKY